MSIKAATSSLLRIFLYPFEILYWVLYFSGGWVFQLLRYLALRDVKVLHDLFFCTISVFRFKGRSYSRVIFLLKSRVVNPVSFWHAFMNRKNNSRPLPENWESIRKTILERDGFCCSICGGKNLELHVDHIIPRKWNGSHRKDNLRTLCRHCHRCRHFRKF